MPLEPGQPAPEFVLDSTAGPLSLGQLLAQGPVVLAFYVEDDTPICNTELAAF
ncbi:MAG: redoxin domain-containing protein [Dehalococcoidia bacterium]|nr:redoxin domain-containing protein [Dehalococcoidia bacterium]